MPQLRRASSLSGKGVFSPAMRVRRLRADRSRSAIKELK